jgi:hypothetical protein
VSGTSQYFVNTSFQVIDFITAGAASTWFLSSFYIGDTNMQLGTGNIPADIYFVGVMNRGLRFTTAKAGRQISIGWIYGGAATNSPNLTLTLKVRSYYRG